MYFFIKQIYIKQFFYSVRYLLRYSCNELEVINNLDGLIGYVKTQAKFADSIAENWTGSIMELVVDTLIRLCDAGDFQILRKVSRLGNVLLEMITNIDQVQI